MRLLAGILALALLMGPGSAWAEGPDEEYLEIFNLIQQADDLESGSKAAPAKAKYQQALTALASFQRGHPDWNPKLVSARLTYLTEKVGKLSEKPSAPAGGPTSRTPVRLLQPGAEPRKALRLHPAPDEKQTLSLTLKMATETKAGEAVTPAMKLPTLKMTLEANVKRVADDGNITCMLTLRELSVSDEPGIKPEVTEAMKGTFAAVKEITGSGTVSSQGLSEGFELKAAAESNPQTSQFAAQMKDLVGQLVVPLPAEEVGVGARWEARTTIKSQGMNAEQTATYELVSVEGERLTVKATTVQNAGPQKIQNEAMPAMKMDLVKMTGKGSGERTINLAHVLPTAGSATYHTETAMTMDMGGKKQPMTAKMDLDLRFEGK